MVDSEFIPKLKVFISSPGDVKEQRDSVQSILEALVNSRTYRNEVSLQIVRWDDAIHGTRMSARHSPQDAINRGLPRPQNCDLVVVMFWSRLGTPCVVEGQKYHSGTHFELADALRGKRDKAELLIYHRTEEPDFPQDETGDPLRKQLRALNAFLKSDDFHDPDTKQPLTMTEHETAEAFEKRFREDVEGWLKDCVAKHKAKSSVQTHYTPEKPDGSGTPTIGWVDNLFPGVQRWIHKHRLFATLFVTFSPVVIWLILAVISALIGEITTRVLLTDPVSLPTSAVLTLVYGDREGFTLVIREDSLLQDVQLVTITTRSAPIRLNEDFPSAFRDGIVAGQTCLVYQLEGTTPALPRVCQREGVVIAEPRILTTPFWYDSGAMIPVQIERTADNFTIDCIPEMGNCLIDIPALSD